MRQKKGKFFTFIFSLLPGAAEMYMGFMKMGFSIMAIFFLSIFIPTVLRTSDAFVLMAFLIWFWGFFHARNLAACNDETFQDLPDEFIWESFAQNRKIEISNPTLRKWGAGILIFFGVVILWQNISSIIYSLIPEYLWNYLAPWVDRVPQIAIAILIIIIGVKMIMGKKEELDGDGN